LALNTGYDASQDDFAKMRRKEKKVTKRVYQYMTLKPSRTKSQL
jgi:hypothetical protein